MPGADLAEQAWARITVPYIAQRPVMRRSPDGGRSFPRSSSKGYRYEVAIKAALPTRPTTVPTCDPHTGAGQLLVLDLDVSRVPAGGAADRPAHVAATSERIVRLMAECGGRALVDVSPSGGHHVYVLWATARRHAELRELSRAFALRFPVVDTSPMESSDGQIRGPGSPHKSEGGRLTGYMRLVGTIAEAEDICARPNGADVWEALHIELAAELDEVAGGVVEARRPDGPVDLDASGVPWRPRRGGRAQLREDLEQTARTARYDSARYRSSSEARQAVLTSAAARGWRLHQVQAQLGGPWAAIAGWWRDHDLLRAEWAKAVTISYRSCSDFLDPAGEENLGFPLQRSNTRETPITPPPSQPVSVELGGALPSDLRKRSGRHLYSVKKAGWLTTRSPRLSSDPTPYQQIRTWQQGMRIVERLMELEWGERALAYRAVLRAAGAAAQMTCSLTIEFGCRQFAVMTGLDHTTVSRALKALSTGPYALLDLVRPARGTRADTYHLIVPDAVAHEAAWRRWRPGRIDAIHTAFRTLGLPAAFVYEVLSTAGLSASEASSAALVPRSTTYEALHTLAAHGLAERDTDGAWRRGPADLDIVAAAIGADELMAAQITEHRRDRADWHAWLKAVGLLSDHESLSAVELQNNQPDQVEPPTTGNGVVDGAGSFPAKQPRLAAGKPTARAWMTAPSRQRLIGETDIGWPAEALAALREMPDPRGAIPDDVREAIAADWAIIDADAEHLVYEVGEYEDALTQLRLAAAELPLHAPPMPLLVEEADGVVLTGIP